jgi:hypothetical protein
MDIRARRALGPVLAAAFLLLSGWHAAPARAASVDPELVAESVSEDGYYVDSSASYLRSDSDLDKLRAALQQAGRAGVVVLPAGTAAGPVLTRLLQTPNRHATYVVLSGTRLQAASNNLSKSQVGKLVAKATKAGDPKSQVLTFLDLMNPKQSGKRGGATHKGGNLPEPSASGSAQPDSAAAAPATAAKKNDSGGNGLLYGIGGVVVVAVLATAGGILWRRKQATSAPGGSTSGQ